jgi:zona occludens toxin
MAIEFLTGLPGHGKSLYAIARYIIPCLRAHKRVYHNVHGLEQKKNLIPSYFPEVDIFAPSDYLIEIPADRVNRFWEFIAEQGVERGEQYAKGCLVVIDEVQNFFSARDFMSKNNKDLVSYMTEHRHLYHDILFITQHQDNVDTAVRRMVEISYLVRNNKNFGSSKSSTVYTYLRDAIGPKLEIATGSYSYDKRIFNLYDSYVPTASKDKNFKEHKKVVRWWLHWKILASFGFIFLMVIWAFSMRGSNQSMLFGAFYGKPKQSQVAKKVELPKAAPDLRYGELYHSGDTTFYLCKSGRVDTSFTDRPWEACR